MKKKKPKLPSISFSLSQLKFHETIEWNHKGLRGVISNEKIKNAIQYLEDLKKLMITPKGDPAYIFYWEDVEDIEEIKTITFNGVRIEYYTDLNSLKDADGLKRQEIKNEYI